MANPFILYGSTFGTMAWWMHVVDKGRDPLLEWVGGTRFPSFIIPYVYGAALGTFANWIFTEKTGNDRLLRDVIKIGDMPVNVWIASHFATWLLIGYKWPNQYDFVIKVGLAWEIFEYIFSKLYSTYWGESVAKQSGDVLANILGYFVGSHMNQGKF